MPSARDIDEVAGDDDMLFNRREFVKIGGMFTLAGLLGLSGCTAKATPDPYKNYPKVPHEPDYLDWFDGVSNYSRTVDARGNTEVTILVGTETNVGKYGFGPAAIAVSPGTTVTWKWTGDGGTHNVVADTGAFDSGPLVDREGHTFSHTFTEPRIYKYVCEPHATMGMRGAVFCALGERGS